MYMPYHRPLLLPLSATRGTSSATEGHAPRLRDCSSRSASRIAAAARRVEGVRYGSVLRARRYFWRTVLPSPLAVGYVQAATRRRRRLPSLTKIALHAQGDDKSDARGQEQNVPTDEEMRVSLRARLPPEERISRDAGENAERTLQRADERIAELGIDLDAFEKKRSALAASPGPELIGPWPLVAVIAPGDSDAEVLAALRQLLPEDSVRWLDLSQIASMSPLELSKQLEGCQAMAICPGTDMEKAGAGLVGLLKCVPEVTRRIALLAGVGRDEPTGEKNPNPFGFLDAAVFGGSLRREPATRPLEDLLTMAARQRNDNQLEGLPINVTLVRAEPGDTVDAPSVHARMPATVRQAASGLRAMYIGGTGSLMSSEEEAVLGKANPKAIASVLAYVLRFGVDVTELTVTGGEPETTDGWGELMLPLMGPELWRIPVDNPTRARAWLQGWVEFNFTRGASQGKSSMRRAGLRTPVESRKTLLGVCLKFLPSTSDRKPGTGFDGLEEGGLEISVDDARPGVPGRLRVRRCAYKSGKRPLESSERTILSRLRRDWETSQSFTND